MIATAQMMRVVQRISEQDIMVVGDVVPVLTSLYEFAEDNVFVSNIDASVVVKKESKFRLGHFVRISSFSLSPKFLSMQVIESNS